MASKEPLAYRMCPRTIEEFFGQEHILGKGKLLYRMIKADRLSSVIFFGPPGTGKTSLARIIAETTSCGFEKLNAVSSGVSDIKKICSDAENKMLYPGGRVVLFIDEIHRFNKAQQDALLPSVENGTIILIGATTENPFFEVNKAIISRSTVFQLYPLSEDNIKSIIVNALNDKERGYGNIDITLEKDALDFLAVTSAGDARIALNALELAVMGTDRDLLKPFTVTRDEIAECLQRKVVQYDKSGEGHYDNISAMIKSMRGSDPDAAVFYLARALYAGEDINFLARRITICASEDVGMANPNAILVCAAVQEAVRMIGMPEARILLSQAAVTVATSPKSNSSYLAVEAALNDVRTKDTGEVPFYLRNAATEGMKDLGYHVGYKYAHDFEGHVADLEYLPEQLRGTKYYFPDGNGYEKNIVEYLKFVDTMKEKNKNKT
ncbi:MAG: replication-associated recombination protein A [Clostridia bacterium]|nr:replication-associated recombination protein A [Clostridia bacterium]